MADILVQFHALVDELNGFVRDALEEVPASVTAFRFWPFEAVRVEVDDVEAMLRDHHVREIAFTLDPPKLPVKNSNEFLDLNPSALRLDIGRLSEHGLHESCLSARTTDRRSLEAWRKFARRLRKTTKAGAVAVNPVTGATAMARNHRYTAGAKALSDKGVEIKPIGGNVLRLGAQDEEQ
ncbi:MAG: hypothetical protein AAFX94_18330 [Myxococcota bacterium]